MAHEYGHAVTEYSAGLIYEGQSGALNESMSDFWAIMIDRDDWMIGEEIWTPKVSGDALRYVDDPTRGNQPSQMNNYLYTTEDNGGVHANSGILNKAFYNIIQLTNKDIADKIYFRALITYFTQSTDFLGARDSLYLAARDLYGVNSIESKAVRTGFDMVDVTPTIEDFEAVFYYTPYSTPHPYENLQTYTKTFYFPSATGLKARFANFNTENGYDFVRIKDKTGKVCYTYAGLKQPFTTGPVSGDTLIVEFKTDNSITSYGFDVEAIGTNISSSSNEIILNIDHLLPAPNPYNPNNGLVHIGFELNQAALCRIYIYTINGDLIYSNQENVGYGYNEFTWNGFDKSQKVLNGGFYVYVIAEKNGQKVKKFTKIAVIRK